MSTVSEEIREFVNKLRHGHGKDVLRFLYNLNASDFRPGVDPVYYSGPVWDETEIVAILESIFTGQWLVSGENVRHFERDFSRRFNHADSVMVNSGSSANLAMIASVKKHFQWCDSDEVLLSVVGFPTTLSPLIHIGLKPVFVDIDFGDLNFDIGDLEKRITDRTKAIFISPVLGNPPNMERLSELATKHDLELILDDCDSLGSRWDGRFLSDFCIASSCSFYPAHHICTGEGGMISSHDSSIVALARSFAWWGRDCYCVGAANLLPSGTCGNRFDRWLPGYDGEIDHKYVFTNVGFNLKPLDLQGAIGVVQVKKFDEIHQARRANKTQIQRAFEHHLSCVRIIDEHPLAETSWFGVPVVCDTQETKKALVRHLEENRIQTRNYFAGNLLLHPAYSHLGVAEDYPNAMRVLERVFFVGCTPTYSKGMLDHIEHTIKSFADGKGQSA